MALLGLRLVLSLLLEFYIFFVIEAFVVVSAQVVGHYLDQFAEDPRILLFFPKAIYYKTLLVECHVGTLYTVAFEALELFILLLIAFSLLL